MSLLDKLFVSLRVLSKLPEGGRICTTGTGQIKIEDTDTFGGWIATGRRRLTGDSREEAVKVLMQIINEVGERSDLEIESIRNYPAGNNAPLAHQLENAKKCQTLDKICTMLKSAKKGMVNLHGTYSDDANITAKLEEIMEKMDSQHQRITEVLQRVRGPNGVTYSRSSPPSSPRNQRAFSPPQSDPPVIRVVQPAERHSSVAPAPLPHAQNQSVDSDEEENGFDPFNDD